MKKTLVYLAFLLMFASFVCADGESPVRLTRDGMVLPYKSIYKMADLRGVHFEFNSDSTLTDVMVDLQLHRSGNCIGKRTLKNSEEVLAFDVFGWLDLEDENQLTVGDCNSAYYSYKLRAQTGDRVQISYMLVYENNHKETATSFIVID